MTILSNYYGHNNLVGRTGVNAHPASAITNTPAGTIAATDVQSAINEVSGDVTGLQAKYITQDTTVTVKTSEGDYTTIQGALDAYKDTQINEDAVLTIEIDDGAWAIDAAINCDQACSHRIRLAGKTLVSGTISSVASSSGSSGNWSYVLNTTTTAGVAQNDWVIISGAANGVNPNYIRGFYKVTALTGSTLTVNVTHVNASAASGAVTANWFVVKATITTIGTGGIVVGTGQHGFYSVDNLGLIGNSGGGYGIDIYPGGSMSLLRLGHIGISKYTRGINILGGALYANSGTYNLAITVCNYGIVASANSTMYWSKGSVAACSVQAANCQIGSAVNFANGAVVITGNATGLYASTGGFVYAISTVVTGNTADFSPSANTLGNENGYIDT